MFIFIYAKHIWLDLAIYLEFKEQKFLFNLIISN